MPDPLAFNPGTLAGAPRGRRISVRSHEELAAADEDGRPRDGASLFFAQAGAVALFLQRVLEAALAAMLAAPHRPHQVAR